MDFLIETNRLILSVIISFVVISIIFILNKARDYYYSLSVSRRIDLRDFVITTFVLIGAILLVYMFLSLLGIGG